MKFPLSRALLLHALGKPRTRGAGALRWPRQLCEPAEQLSLSASTAPLWTRRWWGCTTCLQSPVSTPKEGSVTPDDYGMARAFEEPTLRYLFEGNDVDFREEVRAALAAVLPPRPRQFVGAGQRLHAPPPPPPGGSSSSARREGQTRLDSEQSLASVTRLLLRSLLHRGLISYAMQGSTPGRLLSLYEVVATANPVLASVVAQHLTAAGMLASHGSPSLRQRYPHWLDQADTGQVMGTIATRELVVDDGPPLNTEARYDYHDKCFVLRGTGKFAVVGAAIADYVIVSATLTTNKKEHNGIHLFAVPLRHEKQEATSSSAALGSRRSDILVEPLHGEGDTVSASGVATIYFDHTKIPADHLLGPFGIEEATGAVVLRSDASIPRLRSKGEGERVMGPEPGVEVLTYRTRLATAAITLGILKKEIRDAVQYSTQQHVVGPSGYRTYPYLGLQEIQSPLVSMIVKTCLYGLAWNQFVQAWCTLESKNSAAAKSSASSLFKSLFFVKSRARDTRNMQLTGLLYSMQETVQVELENFRRRFTHLHASLESTGSRAGSTTLQLRQESKNSQDWIHELAWLSVVKNIGTTHWGWRVSSWANRFPALQRLVQNPLYSPRMADLGRHYLFFSHKHFRLKKKLQRSMKIETKRGGSEHSWHDWRTFRHRDVRHCGEAFMEIYFLEVIMEEMNRCSGDLRARKILRDIGWIYVLTRQSERLEYYLFTGQLSKRKAVILLPHLDNISTVFAPQSRHVVEALCGRWYDSRADRSDRSRSHSPAAALQRSFAALTNAPCASEAYWTIPGAMTHPERGDQLRTAESVAEEKRQEEREARENTREGQEAMQEETEELDLLHGLDATTTTKKK